MKDEYPVFNGGIVYYMLKQNLYTNNHRTHTFGTDWKKDEQNHWRECECGIKSELAEHAFGEWKIYADANYAHDGLEKRSCKVCGYEEEKPIPSKPVDGLIKGIKKYRA